MQSSSIRVHLAKTLPKNASQKRHSKNATQKSSQDTPKHVKHAPKHTQKMPRTPITPITIPTTTPTPTQTQAQTQTPNTKHQTHHQPPTTTDNQQHQQPFCSLCHLSFWCSLANMASTASTALAIAQQWLWQIHFTIALVRGSKRWSCSRTLAPEPGRRWSTSSATHHGDRSLHFQGAANSPRGAWAAEE